MIVAENGTPYGIELTFSKPMDPVAASNVKNYAVHVDVVHKPTARIIPSRCSSPLASSTFIPQLVP